MDYKQLLSSVVVSALVAAFITLWTSQRKIQIENITQERAKWREKIRSNAQLVHKAAMASDKDQLSELRLVFELLLNPGDEEDLRILGSIERLSDCTEPAKRLPEFSKRVAYLLKHDWERAKREAKPWWCRIFKKTPRESLG